MYQTYYETGFLSTSTPSDISWIGSVQATLLLTVGALSGPIYDAGYFKSLVFVGSFFVVFGQMMLSLCKEYYQVLLAQAFCVGIGAGCLFTPSVAVISQYFTTKIATAMGLAATGSSLGKCSPIAFTLLFLTSFSVFRWRHISNRPLSPLTKNRLPVGNSCARLHHARYFYHPQHFHESPSPPCT